MQFASEAKSLGLQELLLPVIYVPVADLDEAEQSGDEVLLLIAETQWENWSSLRLLDERSTEYRIAVNKLATRLAEISDSIQSNPPSSRELNILADADHDAPGSIDLMADAEAALPEWADSMNELVECLNELTTVTIPFTERAEKNDRAGGGFAGRLQLMRQYAAEAEPVADKMSTVGNRYSSHLMSIDPAILTLLREASESSELASAQEAQELFSGIKELAVNSAVATAEMRNFSVILADAGRTSRDLRPITKKIASAVQSVIDGQAIIDEWVRRINDLD